MTSPPDAKLAAPTLSQMIAACEYVASTVSPTFANRLRAAAATLRELQKLAENPMASDNYKSLELRRICGVQT